MRYILVYGFSSISPKKRLEFNRKLYGYSDKSNYGTYSYFRKGLLDPESFEKLAKGVVLMEKKPQKLIKLLKSYKANYRFFKIIS